MEWGALLLPRLVRTVEAEAEAAEREEKKKQKEERRAAILAKLEADEITGDAAEELFEKLDDEFGPDEEEPEPEQSTNDDDEGGSDFNLPLDDDFEPRLAAQAR